MRAIILAAGKGVRMNSELPKVLHPLLGKPLISHVIDNIRQSGIFDITVVVGYKGEEVKSAIERSVDFSWQNEQLGTGHAVMQARSSFENYKGCILVACGDAPLITAASFERLFNELSKSNVKASVLTMILDKPNGYGRIVKGDDGSLVEIVEEKDATSEQKCLCEVNTGTYVFDSGLLFEGLAQLKNNNAQNEYYLTDIVSYIADKGFKVSAVPLKNPSEGRGINSKEELHELEEEIRSGKIVI